MQISTIGLDIAKRSGLPSFMTIDYYRSSYSYLCKG